MVMVHVDNTGVIFMGKNMTMSLRTKYVDICTKYVNEYVEDGIVKRICFRSEDNTSDIMTENINEDLCDKHSNQLVAARL